MVRYHAVSKLPPLAEAASATHGKAQTSTPRAHAPVRRCRAPWTRLRTRRARRAGAGRTCPPACRTGFARAEEANDCQREFGMKSTTTHTTPTITSYLHNLVGAEDLLELGVGHAHALHQRHQQRVLVLRACVDKGRRRHDERGVPFCLIDQVLIGTRRHRTAPSSQGPQAARRPGRG